MNKIATMLVVTAISLLVLGACSDANAEGFPSLSEKGMEQVLQFAADHPEMIPTKLLNKVKLMDDGTIEVTTVNDALDSAEIIDPTDAGDPPNIVKAYTVNGRTVVSAKGKMVTYTNTSEVILTKTGLKIQDFNPNTDDIADVNMMSLIELAKGSTKDEPWIIFYEDSGLAGDYAAMSVLKKYKPGIHIVDNTTKFDDELNEFTKQFETANGFIVAGLLKDEEPKKSPGLTKKAIGTWSASKKLYRRSINWVSEKVIEPLF